MPIGISIQQIFTFLSFYYFAVLLDNYHLHPFFWNTLQTIVFERIGNFDIQTYHDSPVDCQTFQLIVVSIWLTDKFRKKQKWLPCALLWIFVSFSILMIHWTCLLANLAFISNSRSHEPFLCGLPSIFEDPVLIHWSFYSIYLSCCSISPDILLAQITSLELWWLSAIQLFEPHT